MDNQNSHDTLQSSTNENPQTNLEFKGGELIHKEDIPHTPFQVITLKNEDDISKSFVSFGMKRITDYHNTPEEAQQSLKDNLWIHICDVCTILTEAILNPKN